MLLKLPQAELVSQFVKALHPQGSHDNWVAHSAQVPGVPPKIILTVTRTVFSAGIYPEVQVN